MIPTITPRELKDRFDKGDKPFLLDVREPWDSALAKLEGSYLIPLGTLPQSLANLDRNAEIVAYCHRGMKCRRRWISPPARFYECENLIGGIDSWSVQVDPTVPRYR